MSLYLMCIYWDTATAQWFEKSWAKSGKKKLNMGKSCIRFKKLDDIPLDVIGELIRKLPARKTIEQYQKAMRSR
jgi:hypothetical protein